VAVAATAPEERVGDQRDVVVPADRRVAAHAGGAGPHDGAAQRDAGRDDAEEAAESEPRHEDEGEDEVHVLVIDTAGEALERLRLRHLLPAIVALERPLALAVRVLVQLLPELV
jgi:hypothetical protein